MRHRWQPAPERLMRAFAGGGCLRSSHVLMHPPPLLGCAVQQRRSAAARIAHEASASEACRRERRALRAGWAHLARPNLRQTPSEWPGAHGLVEWTG